MKNFILFILIFGIVCNLSVYSQVPNKISYQGLLTTSSGTPVQDGNYDLKFEIFNMRSGGIMKHTETINNVEVTKGVFSVVLHPQSGIFIDSLFIEVTALAGPDITSPITFSPRSELTAAPYAFRADTALYSLSGSSQWSASGSNIYYNLGNVGIGTATPSSKLEVGGQIKITGGSPGLGKILTSDSTGLASWQAPIWIGGTGTIDYIPKFSSTNGLTNSPIYCENLNVGIRTTSPMYTLDVFGNVKFSDFLRVGSNNLILNPYSYSFASTSGLNMSSVNDMTLEATAGKIILIPGPGSSVISYGDLIIPGNGNFGATKARKGGVLFVGTGGKYREDSTKFFWDSTNTRLGIGNGSPSYSLDVIGDVNVSSKYRIGGNVILKDANTNLSVGNGAGSGITTAQWCTFIGDGAGNINSTGSSNTFVGNSAGLVNVGGNSNTFVGEQAGKANSGANYNTFVGGMSGISNVNGNNNSFFGKMAGSANVSGHSNTMIGVGTGANSVADDENTFVGYMAGGPAGITNATAIGSKAWVAQSNSVVLGSVPGSPNGGVFVKVGVGTAIPNTRLDLNGDLSLKKNPGIIPWNPGMLNNNVNFGEYSFVEVNGGGATLTGISNGVDGKIIVIYCNAGGMTIANNNPGSFPQNQIRTMSNANINIIDEGSVTLIYNTSNQKWLVIAFMP